MRPPEGNGGEDSSEGGDQGSNRSDESVDQPDETTVVETAANAAESVVFSRYSRSEVQDLDVTVTFEDGQLEVDIYLDAPGDAAQVADDAALAARGAVDDLFA
ncbi:DUF3194 domain-containing protein [Halovenus marina]|uniref:DUF3194 domain-containing protein n=1 Tax=Halovenus marina TaxID=3396621 RepID=UPI003F564026